MFRGFKICKKKTGLLIVATPTKFMCPGQNGQEDIMNQEQVRRGKIHCQRQGLGRRVCLLLANAFGQVVVEKHKPLQNIFTAGDCSNYHSFGSNTMTAQSAVRKGQLVARNVLRHSGFLKLLEPYLHRDLGYVISLGPMDAVGWLALEGNVVTGIPALMIKELVEAQYDLLLTGIDTYVV